MLYFPESNTIISSIKSCISHCVTSRVFGVSKQRSLFFQTVSLVGNEVRSRRRRALAGVPRPERAGKAGAGSAARCGARPARRVALALHAPPARPRCALPALPSGALGHGFVKILAPVLQVAPEWFRCDRHNAVCPGVSKQTPACSLRFPYLETGWRDS